MVVFAASENLPTILIFTSEPCWENCGTSHHVCLWGCVLAVKKQINKNIAVAGRFYRKAYIQLDCAK